MRKDRNEQEILYGVHPILEVMESQSRRVEKIFVTHKVRGVRVRKLIRMARNLGIPVSHIPAMTLKRMAGTDRHQNVIALMASAAYSSRDEIFSALSQKSVVLVLDHVEDPGNLGSMIRTAAALELSGIFLSEKGSAGLTGATAKRSAGAVEWIKVAREKNLLALVKELRKRSFCIAAVERGGATRINEADFSFPLAVIMGGENRGVRKELIETADMVVEIPLEGAVKTLNVSVACGMVLYEVMRREKADKRVMSIH